MENRADLVVENTIPAHGSASLVYELAAPAHVIAMRPEPSELELDGLTVVAMSAEGIEYMTAHAPLPSVCSAWSPPLDLRGEAGQMIWLILENATDEPRTVRLRLWERPAPPR